MNIYDIRAAVYIYIYIYMCVLLFILLTRAFYVRPDYATVHLSDFVTPDAADISRALTYIYVTAGLLGSLPDTFVLSIVRGAKITWDFFTNRDSPQ